MNMDLKHKHWALIIIGMLVAILLVLIAWYGFRSEVAKAPVQDMATTTPAQEATSTAKTLHLTETAPYYDIDLTYPVTTPLTALNASADAIAVARMKKYAVDIAAQFKSDGNFSNLSADDIQIQGLGERKYALTSNYKVYTGARTVSYVYQIYSDTLGAHPNSYYKTFTFDLSTGKELMLSDLFSSTSSYLQRVSNRARADLPTIIKELGGDFTDTAAINMGTEPNTDNFSAFYIDGKNLVLVFPPYAVGPYALGTVLDPIPLAQLSDGLNPIYLP